jgi:FK506-binding nuclear protein
MPGFWGMVVKPGAKPTPFVPPPDGAVLHLSSATLGGKMKDGARVALRVKVGGEEEETSVLIASFRCAAAEPPRSDCGSPFLPRSVGSSESLQLDLVFTSYAEFSVEGDAEVHLAGYTLDEEGPSPGDDGWEEMDEDEDEDEDEELDAMFAQGGWEEEEDEDEEEAVPGVTRRGGVVIQELVDEPEPPAAKPKAATPAKRAAEPSPAPAAKKAAPSPAAAEKPDKAGSRFEDTPSGLGSRVFDNGMEVINVKAGPHGGKVALAGKRVSMQYTGRLQSNGRVFDASRGKAFSFRLGVGEVIKGWDLGIKNMRVGDARKLVIPPALAYGARGAPPDIPPNAWLVFDVQLVSVQG